LPGELLALSTSGGTAGQISDECELATHRFLVAARWDRSSMCSRCTSWTRASRSRAF
jgi:hypothetical protein